MHFVSIRPPNVAQPLQIFFRPIEIRLLTALEWPSFFSRRIVDIGGSCPVLFMSLDSLSSHPNYNVSFRSLLLFSSNGRMHEKL